jgi:hypothetical protein
MPSISWKELPPYHNNFSQVCDQKTSMSQENETINFYNASCYCGRVQYEVQGEPISSKLCHCRGCQMLHGAPFEWVSIFHKHNVRFTPESLDLLYFYSGELDKAWDSTKAEERILPVKVSCGWCRAPIADEGRNMWLAYSTLFGFTIESGIPPSFQHTDHLFYGQRCIDLEDDKAKWKGHKNKSEIHRCDSVLL